MFGCTPNSVNAANLVKYWTSTSSSFCAQSGQKVTCTVGALSVGTPAQVTIVVAPNGSGTVSLTFTANSANPDLNPADWSAPSP